MIACLTYNAHRWTWIVCEHVTWLAAWGMKYRETERVFPYCLKT